MDAYTGNQFVVVTPPNRLSDTIELSCTSEAALVSMKLRDFIHLERFRPVPSSAPQKPSPSPLEKKQKVRYSVIEGVVYPDIWKRKPA